MGCGASRPPPGVIEPSKAPLIMEKPPAEPPSQTDWTSIAPAHTDLDEHIGNEDVTAEEIARRADNLMTSVFKVFEHELFTGPPPPFHLLAPADADWSQAVPWSLGRVQRD